MKKLQSNSDRPKGSKSNKTNINTKLSSKQKKIKELTIEISKLSYEDSLKELDNILNKLQNETLLLDQLQCSYLKAKLYLEHCEELLNKVEQEVIEIDPIKN